MSKETKQDQMVTSFEVTKNYNAEIYSGLTKREYFAIQILASLHSHSKYRTEYSRSEKMCEIAVRQADRLIFYLNEAPFDYKYNGRNKLINFQTKNRADSFFDFDTIRDPYHEDLSIITQKDVDEAFSVLEALMNGDSSNPETYIQKTTNDIPQKAYVQLTNDIYCEFGKDGIKFIDELKLGSILERDRYDVSDLNTYLKLIKDCEIKEGDAAHVVEIAIIEASRQQY